MAHGPAHNTLRHDANASDAASRAAATRGDRGETCHAALVAFLSLSRGDAARPHLDLSESASFDSFGEGRVTNSE